MKLKNPRAAGWLSQLSIQLLILAQVMISQFVSSSLISGSALAVQSLLRILSPSLWASSAHALSLSLFPSPSLPLPLSLFFKNKLKKSLNIIDPMKTTMRHVIIRLSEVKDWARILKVTREKQFVIYEEIIKYKWISQQKLCRTEQNRMIYVKY